MLYGRAMRMERARKVPATRVLLRSFVQDRSNPEMAQRNSVTDNLVLLVLSKICTKAT